MTVKPLKKILRETFLSLTDHKLIFVNWKSVSVYRAPFFLLQQKLIWLAVLSPKYLFYDFNATGFQKNLKIFWIFFIIGSS